MRDKNSGIAGWPEEERPRERLFRQGEHNLSSAELLAILLGSGTRGEDALSLARRIITRVGSFREMSHTDSSLWKEFKGLGKAKIARIKAALEIGRRFREVEKKPERQRISGAKDVVETFMPRMRDLKKEIFKVIYLDGRNRIITVDEIVAGTPNSAHPLIREIISLSLQNFASGVIAIHNHPSGEPEPSQEDREFTRKVQEVCNLVNVKLLDHIIFGDSTYFSFSESNLL
ncbi:MAG: DNA repair protein RadC [Candidatus Omnitrophota bacterium]